jgi:Carbon-nitrogen hydrolase
LGKQIRSFDTPFGRAGFLICNDRWSPELARALVLDGAQVIYILAYRIRSRRQDRTVLSIGKLNGVPVVEANVGSNLIISGGEVAAQEKGMGIYFEMLRSLPPKEPSLSFLAKDWHDVDRWRTEARAKVVELMDFSPKKISPNSSFDSKRSEVEGLETTSDDFVQAYNIYWDAIESSITISTVLNVGATWPGILFYEDQRSVDYLVSRPEVDPNKIGCGGLSGGGLRSNFLGGLDPRIKAAFCVGWMSSIGGMLRNHIRGNSLAMYVPNLFRLLDIPDIMALRAPSPLLVQYDREDGLFSLEGQTEAHSKISKIYEKMGRPDGYEGKFYAGGHKFDIEMQDDAFKWLTEILVSQLTLHFFELEPTEQKIAH